MPLSLGFASGSARAKNTTICDALDLGRSRSLTCQRLGTKMNDMNRIPRELIAPCGMNCAICSRYLAFVNGLRRSQCIGCRPGNRTCEYLYAKCTGMNNGISTGSAAFCFECDQYPCKHINRMDHRYRNNYEMSVKRNLEYIEKMGIERFADEQYKRYRCSRCDGLISIHNSKCFKCDTVTRLVEKRNRQS